jgi:hypothetical protein
MRELQIFKKRQKYPDSRHDALGFRRIKKALLISKNSTMSEVHHGAFHLRTTATATNAFELAPDLGRSVALLLPQNILRCSSPPQKASQTTSRKLACPDEGGGGAQTNHTTVILVIDCTTTKLRLVFSF